MAESCRPLPVAGFENELANSIPFCEPCIGQVKDAGEPCSMGIAGGVQQPVLCSPSSQPTDHVPRKMETTLLNERERHERELSAVKEELKREREAHAIEINKLKEFIETKIAEQKIETETKIAEQKKELEYKMVVLETMIAKNEPASRSCSLTREVIWVDPNIHNEENSSYVQQLRATEGISLYSTSKASEALKVLKNKRAETEYRAITAGRGGKEFVRSLRAKGIHCRVLVFCGNVELHKTWAKDFSQVEVTRFTSEMMEFATWKA